ncbi:MAG TPA: heme ABC transporter ATP-binding protein [Ferruginibacter sp.]|nr:heme ABC transporter ATP-binding protein [Ferruginibacter sp.]
MLRTENIRYSIEGKQILKGINAEFRAGEFSMILGPNGSGKSTFLKVFGGEIHKNEGNVFYGERRISSIKTEELAKYRAVMSQQPELNFPLTVDEVVMMGRYPHFNFSPNKKDETICGEVMKRMNIQSFSDRNYLTLSGGEKQRVQFARVLAQIWERPANGCRYLFLDEPLASLDIKYQQEFLQIAREIASAETVLVAVLHDINLAIQFADKLLMLKDGKVAAFGKPKEVLTPEVIREVFDVSASIINNPVTGDPLVLYN